MRILVGSPSSDALGKGLTGLALWLAGLCTRQLTRETRKEVNVNVF